MKVDVGDVDGVCVMQMKLTIEVDVGDVDGMCDVDQVDVDDVFDKHEIDG